MLCENCGYINPSDLRFCRNCEIDLKLNTFDVPLSVQSEALIYAGFRVRLLAVMLDILVIVTGSILLLLAIGGLIAFTGRDSLLHDDRSATLFFWIITCASLAYFILMESGAGKATLGKRWLNLSVQDTNGNQLSIARASLRQLAHLVSLLPLFVGLLMQPFTKRKQALHDLLVHSVVVQANESKKISIMATLLVLFIALMVPLLALLATAGQPIFQQQIEKAQLNNGIQTGRAATVVVAHFYKLNGRVPVNIEDADGKIHSSPHIAAIDINQRNGEITLTFSKTVRQHIRNKHVVFKAAITNDQNIVWKCYSADIEARFLPNECLSILAL